MSKVKNVNENKRRLLAIKEILLRETDEEHGLTRAQIQSRLSEMGFNPVCDSTVISEIDLLCDLGLDIEKGWDYGTRYTYRVLNREFSLIEIKVIIDCLNASRFITKKLTNSIIKKLVGMMSKHKRKELNREITYENNFKAINNKIFYNVDGIYNAIHTDRQIEFYYIYHTPDKVTHYRHDKRLYRVSPCEFVYEKDKYYLVGYCHYEKKVKHYRVDKMDKVTPIDRKRKAVSSVVNESPNEYANKYFGMYGGDCCKVKFAIREELVDVFLDRFGRNIEFKVYKEGSYTVEIELVLSPQFVGWVCGLGRSVKVIGPPEAYTLFFKEGKRLVDTYPDIVQDVNDTFCVASLG